MLLAELRHPGRDAVEEGQSHAPVDDPLERGPGALLPGEHDHEGIGWGVLSQVGVDRLDLGPGGAFGELGLEDDDAQALGGQLGLPAQELLVEVVVVLQEQMRRSSSGTRLPGFRASRRLHSGCPGPAFQGGSAVVPPARSLPRAVHA
jgi:hypothetical protein